jgi:acyl-CoA thioesterase
MTVSLVWTAVFNAPLGMEDWQYYRIEYGGHGRECVVEGGIWLRQGADIEQIERLIEGVSDGE